MRNYIYTFIGGAVAGLFAGYGLYRPDQTQPERYAAQVVQSDKSVILEKKPQSDAKPAHQIPKGATVERIVKVIVKAKPEAAPTIPRTSSQWSTLDKTNSVDSTKRPEPDHIADASKKVDCPPVTLDLSVIRNDDGSSNVVASSPDGDIVGAVDIPVVAKIEPVKKWAAGISYNTDKRGGVWIERDFGPFRIGGDVMQNPAGITGMVRLGVRF